MCNPKTCQDHCTHVHLTRGPQNNWVANPPPHEPVGTVHPPCSNPATYRNFSRGLPAGVLELSMCHIRHNDPAAGMHAHPNPQGPLICTQCKAIRYTDWEWRVQELWFGVCTDCSNYVQAHQGYEMGINDRCGCEPAGLHTGGVNGNELLTTNMCRNHDRAFWNANVPLAQVEINRRRTITRKWKKKGDPHKITKRGPAMTPLERRTKASHRPAGPMQAVPRCFCGNILTAANLARNAVSGSVTDIWQIRNCVGCKEFVYW